MEMTVWEGQCGMECGDVGRMVFWCAGEKRGGRGIADG